uniref:G-protein coupled receptors family 3 profile domain-containing protein n=1 Tax=Oryzias melastigma TaxID=30732 RepID=A0A3B3BN88_ORYME
MGVMFSFIVCNLRGATHSPVFSMDGDFVIGGVFAIHYNMMTEIHNHNTMPEPPKCTGRLNQLQYFCTELLPGIKLGYQIHDSCAAVPVAMQAAFQLSNGQDNVFYKDKNCSQSGRMVAVVGDSGSTQSIAISLIIGSFDIPQVSHFSTCACLSDKKQFPNFFRTIPSDAFQAVALAKLVKHFGWTWIGAICSDSDYGNNGMASFLKAAQEEGICVEFSESFLRSNPISKIQRVADLIRRSTAKVIVAFAGMGEMDVLLEELATKPSPSRQWIGSEAWITDTNLQRFTFCEGAIGFAIPKSNIPGLRDFLLDLSLTEVVASPVLTEFWEKTFKYTNTENIMIIYVHVIKSNILFFNEDLQKVPNDFILSSQLRITTMVYKAVYAIAHAIHNVVCVDKNATVLTALKKVNFTQNGYSVSFDTNGDPVAAYELVNWHKGESGNIDSLMRIILKIYFVPVSVCSDRCPPGTYKVLQKGKPICCYDCIKCPEGEISNTTDSSDCFPCPIEFWPNAERDSCHPKPVEFLSINETLAIILAFFSVGGACLAILTAAVFFHHRTTPIVRANNSELSFLLLFSLTLCFLCSLTFIGAPTEWSCKLRHSAFGITFVLCISCVLGKTIVVLMAFKATLPGSNVMKWFGPLQQRLTVVLFTFVQVLICTVWLVLRPPFPMKNFSTYKERIILECALGSAIGFWAVLGYIGLLAVFCFVLAVLARKLPDNFNEAKLITFSMLIFCAVWLTFIPSYVSSPGKFTVAVEIFAILASSFGLIMCIFAPKCFIILCQPKKNTKKYLMSKK